MSIGWKSLNVSRLSGLNLKTNPLLVNDGQSLDLSNVYQTKEGVISKRKGNDFLFAKDSHSGIAPYEIDEIGHANINGIDYYFRFTNGDFEYSTALQGAVTNISPAPAISTVNQIWWVVINNAIWFVDGTNNLRFWDPSLGNVIYDAVVYNRPNPAVVPTSSGGGGFDYTFTVEKGYNNGAYYIGSAETPNHAYAPGGASGATITIDDEIYTGTTLAVGDRLRVYSRVAGIQAWRNVTPTGGAHANGVYELGDDGGGYLKITSVAANYAIVTVALNDDQPLLYTDLGVVINKQAETALKGLTLHYGRLVAWKDDSVFNAKQSNPFSWPDDTAQSESFVYTIGVGDQEDMQRCVSFQEGLYVFKKTQVYVFGGIGPDDTGQNAYSFRRIETDGIGCIAPKSVVVIGEEGQNFLVFLGLQGFYATSGTEPVRIGENIESETQFLTESILFNSVGYHDKIAGLYVCYVGAAGARKAWVLDTRKDEKNLSGWYKWENLNHKCVFYDTNRYLAGNYNGLSVYERQAQTFSDYKDANIDYFADTDVNTGADTITIAAHGYSTGDAVRVRLVGSSTIMNPIVANTVYYLIAVDANTIRLATTQANALANTYIDLTTTGTGDFSLLGSIAISAYYTTNWFNYGSHSIVKKLGRPSVSFNAEASEINITVSQAYDWNNTFTDSSQIDLTGSHIWGSGPAWGSFVWGAGQIVAAPKSVAIPTRKVRSIRYKFLNNTIDQNLDLQGINMPFAPIRNRNNYAA